MKYFEFIQSFKTRSNKMTRCSIPKFCQRYKIDIGIYDFKSKRILPRSVKQRDKRLYNHKNHYCGIWKKNRRDSFYIAVEEIEKKSNMLKTQKPKIFQTKEFVIDFQDKKQ